MSTPNDGGPAFPVAILEDHSSFAKNGMSLLDLFAAAPMSDVELETLREAYSAKFPGAPLSIGRLRYWRADTMLEARAQWYAEHQTPAPVQEPVVIPAQPGEEMQ
jgi:hypothetical protein